MKATAGLKLEYGESGELKVEDDKGRTLWQVLQSPEYFFYRRRREATTFQVRYTLGESNLGREFILDGIVTTRRPDLIPVPLSEEESLPIIQEILRQLRGSGYPASAHVAE